MPLQVIVVGAGPVGCLAALGLAQRGCHVQVFDSRRDPRPPSATANNASTSSWKDDTSAPVESSFQGVQVAEGSAAVPADSNLPAGAISSDPQLSNPAATAPAAHRSINLAISTRGLTGLRSVRPWRGGASPIKGTCKGRDLEHDLADIILSEAVPMCARMIHTLPTSLGASSSSSDLDHARVHPSSLGIKLLSQAYSTVGECINSVDRARLNNLLLDQAARHPLIDVFFEYKLLRADLEHALPQDEQGSAYMVELLFESTATRPPRASGASNGASFATHGQTVLKQCDVVIGCDGHHSKLRGEMVRFVPRMDFSQSYIDNGYVELSIPRRSDHPDAGVREHVPRYSRAGATKRMPDDDEFLLDPNHLHIWPRHDFMLIALPNRDGSFTCTLFAPFNVFRRHLSPTCLYGDDGSVLQDDEQIDRADVQPRTMIDFFQRHFPDALPLISPAALVRDLSSRKPSNLGMVSINPYTYKDRAILLGDSAHAMVPFYGQGLNCGLEDVRVMLQYIDQMLPQEGVLAQARTEEADANHAQSQVGDPGLFARSSSAAAERSTASSCIDSDDKTASSGSGTRVSPLMIPTIVLEEGGEGVWRDEAKEMPLGATAAKVEQEDAVVAPTTAADMHAIRHALRTAFNAYSSHRRSDLVAISSLAIQNYNEMSSRVVSSAYIARMQLDGLLMRTLPKGWWRSLYSMVTFSNERYSAVVQRRDWQNDVVKTAVEVAAGLAAVGLSAGAWAAGRWLLKGSRPG